MTELFLRVAKKAFRFLIDEFQCRLTSKKSDAWGAELTYQNDTTAVNVRYEPREQFVFVLLCRLINGKMPAYDSFDSFGLSDLLTLRAPELKIRKRSAPERFTENDLRHMVITFARGVRGHATDILHGDFSIFPELEKIVKRRAEEFQKGK